MLNNGAKTMNSGADHETDLYKSFEDHRIGKMKACMRPGTV